MIIPTCARCDRPFPANSDLAALPHGKRIAFDPELGRVWRICTKCGEWNLVGPDIAESAVTELQARLPATQPDAIVHDSVGTVDVIIVTALPDATTTTPDALKQRRTTAKLATHARLIVWGITGLGIAVFMYPVIGLTARDTLFHASYGLVGVAGTVLATEITRRIRRQAVRATRVKLALAGLALGVAISIATAHEGLGYLASFAAILIVLHPAIDIVTLPFTGTRIPRDGGGHVRVRWDDAEAIRLGLDDNGVPIADNFRGGGTVTGHGVHAVITKLGVYPTAMPTPADVEQGWMILRRHHDLPGIIRALSDLRPEDTGRHCYGSIPRCWQIALGFAIVEASGTDAERDAIREQIAAASEVAAIAESLDSPRLKPRLGEQKH